MSGPGLTQDRMFGAILMAVGGMIATICGLCSLVTLVGMIGSTVAYGLRGQGPGPQMWLWTVATVLVIVGLVGGVPTLIGVFLFRAGLKRYRGPAKPPDPKVFE